MATMLHDIVVAGHKRLLTMPLAMLTMKRVRVAWVSTCISMHGHGFIPIVMLLHLAALEAAQALLQTAKAKAKAAFISWLGEAEHTKTMNENRNVTNDFISGPASSE